MLNGNVVAIDRYSSGEENDVETYYYLAIDDGETSKDIPLKDREEILWKNVNEVYNLLTYNNLKEIWIRIKDEVINVMENKK